jgi:hypothetical protein
MLPTNKDILKAYDCDKDNVVKNLSSLPIFNFQL